MKPPPLIERLEPSRGDERSHDFNYRIQRVAENLFRLVSYFVYTALALGVMSVICSPNFLAALVMFVIFFVLALFFWLYFMSLTVGPLLYRFVDQIQDPKRQKYMRWASNVAIVVLAVLCGFFVPMQELIDAYVLQLFPQAAECDLY